MIPAALDGERIDRVIATLTGLTRSAAVEAIGAGRASLDGEVVTAKSRLVAEDEELELVMPEVEESLPEADASVEFAVVHEDADLVVVDKPAGLVVHPGAGNHDKTLVNGLLARYPDLNEQRPGQPERPGIVHRLDAGTTGLLVVARNASTHARLVEALKARDVERRYVALVWGSVSPDSGAIDAPIGRAERHRTRMAVSVKGKIARTSYKVLSKCDDPDVTLVTAKLETGRTHQVRVHFAAIGHPLVGDRRYNGYRQSLPFERPFLHAANLAFEHPTSGDKVAFESELPVDMKKLLDTLALSTGLGASQPLGSEE